MQVRCQSQAFLVSAGKTAHVLTGQKQWVYCCRVSPDCSMIASVSGEKSVSTERLALKTGWVVMPRPLVTVTCKLSASGAPRSPVISPPGVPVEHAIVHLH